MIKDIEFKKGDIVTCQPWETVYKYFIYEAVIPKKNDILYKENRLIYKARINNNQALLNIVPDEIFESKYFNEDYRKRYFKESNVEYIPIKTNKKY